MTKPPDVEALREKRHWLTRARGPGLRVSDEVSVDAVLRLALSLSRRAQLEVHEQLGAYLVEVGEPESKYAARVRRQREALDALELVATATDLPPGQAPTTTQFDELAAALGIPWNVSAIGRAFRGWANAQAMYERRVLPETARQVRQRGFLRSHRGRSPIEHLALFGEWADHAEDHSRTAYERWRKNYVAEAASADLPLPLSASQFLKLFPGIGFAELVELRHASCDLTDLVRERAEGALAERPNPLGLATLTQTAALMGKSVPLVIGRLNSRASGFPVVVALVSGNRTLLADDVRQYLRTGRAPARDFGEMQGHLCDQPQLAQTLGMTRPAVAQAVERATGKVPAPDGHVGRYAYWLPSTVEAWASSR